MIFAWVREEQIWNYQKKSRVGSCEYISPGPIHVAIRDPNH